MERFHLRAVCQVRPSHAQAGRSFSLPCSQSECFRGVEIDDEIEFRWLLDPDMVASAPEQVRDVRSHTVAQEALEAAWKEAQSC